MISRRELLSPEGLSKALRRDVSKVEAGTPKMLDQSDVYVLSVTWSDEAPTETLLLKHVSMQSLRQRFNRPDSKWRISLLSFENEYCFYESRPTLQLKAAGVHIPGMYYINRWIGEDPLDRTYDLVMEYLRPETYTQHQNLDAAQCQAALEALARFHAHYWGRTGAEHFERLFSPGCWWRKYLRPAVQFNKAGEAFASLCRNFGPEFDGLDTPEAHALMERLGALSDQIGEMLSAKPNRTLVHGDVKTSNLFFHRYDRHIALIDFQWTGHSPSGGGDVAYLIWTAAQLEALVSGGEETMLRHYHGTLLSALSAGTTYPWEEFVEDYELEFMDYFKTALPQLMNGIDRAYCGKTTGVKGLGPNIDTRLIVCRNE